MCTQLSSEYRQKLLDSAKKLTANSIKPDSKRAVQKTPKERYTYLEKRKQVFDEFRLV